MPVESVSGCSWNRCPDVGGIGVRIVVEYAALRRRENHGDQEEAPPSDEPPPSAPMIIDPATGEVLGEATMTRVEQPGPADAVRMIWHIEGVSREEVDLEALRPYLTDTALLNAARHHLKHHGPHSLKGASYAEKPVLG